MIPANCKEQSAGVNRASPACQGLSVGDKKVRFSILFYRMKENVRIVGMEPSRAELS